VLEVTAMCPGIDDTRLGLRLSSVITADGYFIEQMDSQSVHLQFLFYFKKWMIFSCAVTIY
jgi:hypothetical protein